MNERGQYGNDRGYTVTTFQGITKSDAPQRAMKPWTEAQRQAFQRSMAFSSIGAVAGALMWKEHRVWGFILGGTAGGAVGNLVYSPPTTTFR